MRYVYICSAGHSGSTLLDLLMGSHRDAAGVGELTHLPRVLAMDFHCTCGKPISKCDFWSKIIFSLAEIKNCEVGELHRHLNLGFFKPSRRMEKPADDFVMNFKRRLNNFLWLTANYYTSLSSLYLFGRHVDNVVENTALVYDQIEKNYKKKAVIDSSKSYYKAVELYRKFPDNTRIVFLVRDGRGIFNSGLKRGFNRQYALKNFTSYYSRLDRVVARYVAPEHVHFIKYEDLVQQTCIEIKKICDFIGLDFQEDMLNYSKDIHHLVNGNIEAAATSNIRLDDSWKKQLSNDDMQYFNDNALDLNTKFGYK